MSSTSLGKPALSEEWGDRAYNAALHFCVMPRDVNSPMTDASLAKLFYQHIPKAVEMDKNPPSRILEARSLAKNIERDMVVGREYDTWLAAFNHLKPETRAIFARGAENALNPVLDRLADIGGYERDDVLMREAREDGRGHEVGRNAKQSQAETQKESGKVISLSDRMRHTAQSLAAMRSLGIGD